MREYLKRLAGGNFIYEETKLELSDSHLDFCVEAGAVEEYQFTLKANQPIKGIVWSSNERVIPKEQNFSGIENTIAFAVNAVGLKEGELLSGSFDIVSSGGEISLTYEFQVTAKAYRIGEKEIENVFQFSVLCQSDREEAQTVFLTNEFRDIVLHEDSVLCNVYDVLSKGSSVTCAMEEFLIAAHKKLPVTVRLSGEEAVFEKITENIQEQVELIKSGWGDVNITADADADFIRLLNRCITKDDFTGNHYALPYILDYDKMHAGQNYGRILIKTHNQELIFTIAAQRDEKMPILHEEEQALVKLTKEYLLYRMKKKDMLSWVESSNQILDRIRGIDGENLYYKLVQAQLCFAAQRNSEGEWLLENVKSLLGKGKQGSSIKDIELYCYYLYVNSVFLKDEAYTGKVAAVVREYYENGCDTWRMLWLLFYLDSTYNRNLSIKLLRMKDVCHKGCTSPMIYIEALSIMNTQPALLRVFNRFEMQVLNFGCKYKLISERLALQASDLIVNEKYADKKLVALVEKLYAIYDRDEILSCLVTHMIRNGMTGKGSFPLYEKGVLRGLRITQLYEYYIKSMDKTKMPRLPKMVLMYFSYDTAMDHADKAYLYANVLANESGLSDIMNLYTPLIEHFAYEQMKCGNLDDFLIPIYRFVWNEKFLDEFTQDFMQKLMFTYKVTCFETGFTAVTVKHKELAGVESYPVTGQTAYVQMYTENCTLAFLDSEGVLRKDSIKYEVVKVFDDDSLINRIFERCSSHLYLRLHLFENRNKYKLHSDAVCDIALPLMAAKELEPQTRYALNAWMIHYYNTYFVGEDFRLHYTLLDHKGLHPEEAVKLIEVCITQELYDKAYDLVEMYGYSGVAPLKLFRLARNMMDSVYEEEDPVLLQMCSFAFWHKTYNEEILKYLVLYYNGSNAQMYEVWKACQNFKVDTLPLAERIVAQMLFTGEHNGRMTEVFGYYCANGGRRMVIQAYVAYHSYLYFIRQKKANDIVFRVVEQLLSEDRDLPDVCSLALLKNFSGKTEELTASQLELTAALLNRLCKENKLFGFFKKFAQVIDLPYNMMDKTVIEYYYNPKARVEIHYTVNEGEEIVEVMSNTCGVFTKSFTLFYGDGISYYFVADCGGKEIKTSLFHTTGGGINPERTESRFDYLNDMLASKELHDVVTMRKLMYGYSVQDYVAKQIFKQM